MRRSLTLILCALLIIALARFAQASTNSDRLSQELYNPEEVDLADAMHLYHTRITDYFNNKLLLFLSKSTNPQVADELPQLLEDGVTRGECTAFNVSTYCVVEGALDEYVAYTTFLNGQRDYYQGLALREQTGREGNAQEFLDAQRQKLQERNTERERRGLPPLDVDAEMAAIRQSLGLPANDAPGVPITRSLPIGAAAFSASNRISTIQNELTNSKRALDMTISAYQEFRMAYPLHIEYTAIIEKLKLLRDALGELRSEVHQYPGKFIDAASPDCT